jgi:hypothetical protein
VPLTRVPSSGRAPEAASSKVKLVPLASSEPPLSVIRMVLWPAGETSSSPMSSGHVWFSPLTVTFTSVTEVPSPETEIWEG